MGPMAVTGVGSNGLAENASSSQEVLIISAAFLKLLH